MNWRKSIKTSSPLTARNKRNRLPNNDKKGNQTKIKAFNLNQQKRREQQTKNITIKDENHKLKGDRSLCRADTTLKSILISFFWHFNGKPWCSTDFIYSTICGVIYIWYIWWLGLWFFTSFLQFSPSEVSLYYWDDPTFISHQFLWCSSELFHN